MRSPSTGRNEEDDDVTRANVILPGDPPLIDPTTLTTQQIIREIGALHELLNSRITAVSEAAALRRDVVETRLTAMDKAIVLLHDATHLSPSIQQVFSQHEEKFRSIALQFGERDIRQAQSKDADATAISAALQAHKEMTASMQAAIVVLQEYAARTPSVNEVYLQHEQKFDSIRIQFTERDIRTEQTTSSSKVAVDAALQAQKEAASAQNDANAAAITKSEAAFTKQIDAIGTLIQTTTKSTDEKIDDMKERITQIEARKTGSNESWGIIAVIATIVIAAAGLAMMILVNRTIP